jgi:hypothetical protein
MKRKKTLVNKLSLIKEGSLFVNSRLNNNLFNDTKFVLNLHPIQSYDYIFRKLISSLVWHPRYHNILLVGSRGGDIAAVKLATNSVDILWPGRGRGRGATITEIKFDLWDHHWFYTSSTCGKIIKRHIHGNEDIILKDSCDNVNDENFAYVYFRWRFIYILYFNLSIYY